MLLDMGALWNREDVRANAIAAVNRSTRDTDVMGWYEESRVIGVIFTELGQTEAKLAVNAISRKVTDALYKAFTVLEVNEVRIIFHVFPEDWAESDSVSPATSTLQLILELHRKGLEREFGAKRVIDLAGSAVGILVLSPLLLLIAMAVKLTSRGPVLFRQERIGRGGKRFTFFKFRSMYVNTDYELHREYVYRFIEGTSEGAPRIGKQVAIYKLTSDPRITPLGRILRKTSMDELPQLLNVLLGDMSLVGPRPPVTYEFEKYRLWHRQRLSVVKPGITGLWQVEGRSRVKFDDMVRLDLTYIRSWSLWLDIKILLRTPRAVFLGEGAC